MSRSKIETEDTEQGCQVLVPGVRPVTTKDRLQLLADAPLKAHRPQKPLCVGLFDECARNQPDFFTQTQEGVDQ